jgi:hypothetical protein
MCPAEDAQPAGHGSTSGSPSPSSEQQESLHELLRSLIQSQHELAAAILVLAQMVAGDDDGIPQPMSRKR